MDGQSSEGVEKVSCCCDTPGLMPVEQAKEKIWQAIDAISATEVCLLEQGVGRVLAEDLYSPLNVPPNDNSAMDGYALRIEDLKSQDSLTLIGKSLAGHPYEGNVGEGQCVRIMTGAKMPEGADTVVMQENTSQQDDTVTFLVKPSHGTAVRKMGEDILKGNRVMSKGRQLSPIDIGQLASLGIGRISVFRKVKVALISTGDEITAPGEELARGNIFDSNRPALRAMLSKLPIDIIDLGIIRDDKTALEEAFRLADKEADLVLTSGGVSVGEADYTKEVLQEMGQIHFWKLAIKPGKPLAFGKLPNSVFFGLPGNPVSAMVTFHQIALPTLQLMSGRTPSHTLQLSATAFTPFKKRAGRTDYQRAICWTDEHGQLQAKPTGSQGSGILSSISHGNCYVVLEQDRGHVEAGEQVTVQLFDQFLLS